MEDVGGIMPVRMHMRQPDALSACTNRMLAGMR